MYNLLLVIKFREHFILGGFKKKKDIEELKAEVGKNLDHIYTIIAADRLFFEVKTMI